MERVGVTTATTPGGRWPVPTVLDGLVAAAFVAMVLAEAVLNPAVASPLSHALVAGLAMASLAWRRFLPVTVAALVVAAQILLNPDNQYSTVLALVLVSYTIGAEVLGRRSWLGLAVVVVPYVVVMLLQGLVPSDVAAVFMFVVGPWVVGQAVRQRGDNAQAAVAEAERRAREHEARAAAAVAEERSRIARELHDIVSHSISVVAIQTQAVRRRLGPGQEAEVQDLALVEDTAREALAEMRRLFGVLRSDGEALSLAPQPGLHELDRLVGSVRRPGLDVEVRVEGAPVELTPGLDLAAYRVVQEGLTNAVRHAQATRVDVLLRYLEGCLEVSVEDDGRGLPDSSGPDGADGGHGLVGVRERAALYGGAVELSSGTGGGTRLAVSLPLRPAP
ncbi:sensor histidine kinase [Nocardioides sp. GCM10027113]|uniref:sensor histidine kinase n=1 Tax=unclassified Nocardioides TaxID=2615069 RepID=UPI00361E7945